MRSSYLSVSLALALASAAPAVCQAQDKPSILSRLTGRGGQASEARSGAGEGTTGAGLPQSAPGQFPIPSQRGGPTALTRPSGARSDDTVLKSGATLPEPRPLDEMEGPQIALPSGPIEPHLLTKQQGPFMIHAHTFRGPEATRYALALVLELEHSFRLPAYIFHLRIHPGNSNIRNAQPTAPPMVANGVMPPGEAESYRVYDEAAVLVGNCRSMEEAKELLKKVKSLHPVCLDGLPSIWSWRKKGLKRAWITVNPYKPTQELFEGGAPHEGHLLAQRLSPQKIGGSFDPSVAIASYEPTDKSVQIQHNEAGGVQVVIQQFGHVNLRDPFIERINKGPRNITHCPGPYTLQVAEFAGRNASNPNDPLFSNQSFLRQSPLGQAQDQAEELAAALAKCRALPKGYQPYVYHDRLSSKVMLGSFRTPNDPAVQDLRKVTVELSNEMASRKLSTVFLAPASTLTEISR